MAPYGWEITQDPASRRWGELGEEQAVIHGPDGPEAWFLRGNLEIPVHDAGTPFAFTVWVSVDEATFDRAGEVWNDPARVHEPPGDGALTAWVPTYDLLEDARVMMRERELGMRPLVFVDDVPHALATDQRTGIEVEQLARLAVAALHGEPAPGR